jgi:hypothetical protein
MAHSLQYHATPSRDQHEAPSTGSLVAKDKGRKSLALELVSTHTNTTGGDTKIESTMKSS